MNEAKRRYCIMDILLALVIFTTMTIYYMHFYVPGSSSIDFPAHCDLVFEMVSCLRAIIGSQDYSMISNCIAYPGWHFLFALIYKVIHDISLSLGLTQSVFVTASFLAMLYAFRTFFNSYAMYNRIYSIKVYGYSLALTFVGPLFCSVINPRYYLGQLTSNAWHNPTIMAVKPFAIICFVLFFKLLHTPKKGLFIKLAFFLLISTLFKPSFAQIFIPAVTIFCCMELWFFRTKKFDFCVKCALALIPTLIMLVIQYYAVFFLSDLWGGDRESIRFRHRDCMAISMEGLFT